MKIFNVLALFLKHMSVSLFWSFLYLKSNWITEPFQDWKKPVVRKKNENCYCISKTDTFGKNIWTLEFSILKPKDWKCSFFGKQNGFILLYFFWEFFQEKKNFFFRNKKKFFFFKIFFKKNKNKIKEKKKKETEFVRTKMKIFNVLALFLKFRIVSHFRDFFIAYGFC